MAGAYELQIEKREDGTHVANHAGVLLQTAFQPIFRFHDDRLQPVACEALLRVTRGTTPVLPDAWLGSLNEAEFRAIEPQLLRLHIRNAGLLPLDMRRLFLNFDPRIPEHPAAFQSVLRDLGDELRAAGISPADIACEITEAETVNDNSLTHFAYELRARGYMIAVDDFGANASRPARVRALAPDIVKFDGRLVRRLMSTRTGMETLKGLVARFQNDRISCLLEGLKSIWEVQMAETTGAAMVQGYALAAPRIAASDITVWLDQYQPNLGSATTGLVKRFS